MPWLAVASPPCVADNFAGEIVALNLDTGLYFSIPGLAGAVWRDLNAGHAVDDIIAELAASDPELGNAARRLIDSLVEHGLMHEVPAPETMPAAPEFRPLVAAGVRELTLTPFDDMKDLVMTDPIHEVDEEIGWPVRPQDHA